MQKTTEAICDWLEAHPESQPKTRRFAEYYIPTTLKLLHTYNDVQEIGRASCRERVSSPV